MIGYLAARQLSEDKLPNFSEKRDFPLLTSDPVMNLREEPVGRQLVASGELESLVDPGYAAVMRTCSINGPCMMTKPADRPFGPAIVQPEGGTSSM